MSESSDHEFDIDPDMTVDRARQQYIELAELAGSLAHELKNPLSVIAFNMELLHEDLEQIDHPETRRAVKRVTTCIKQCRRLETLLKDFLRFTKLSRLELKAGDLNRLVQQVLDFFEPQVSKQGIQVMRYLDADLPTIRMESQSLEAAIINLVKNAVEAMPDGGQLVVRSRLIRAGVALDLIDTGSGMDSATLINMFNHFYTSKNSGSGLGLPTAKKIIEAHGGRINVQSELGRGTQITLEFPTPPRIHDSHPTPEPAGTAGVSERHEPIKPSEGDRGDRK